MILSLRCSLVKRVTSQWTLRIKYAGASTTNSWRTRTLTWIQCAQPNSTPWQQRLSNNEAQARPSWVSRPNLMSRKRPVVTILCAAPVQGVCSMVDAANTGSRQNVVKTTHLCRTSRTRSTTRSQSKDVHHVRSLLPPETTTWKTMS